MDPGHPTDLFMFTLTEISLLLFVRSFFCSSLAARIVNSEKRSEALHILCLRLGANNPFLDIQERFMSPMLHLFVSTFMSEIIRCSSLLN